MILYATLIERVAYDWMGVICGHVSEESLNSCPCPCGEDDENEEDGGEDGEDRNPKVDAHILAAFQKLSDVQDAAQCTAANR